VLIKYFGLGLTITAWAVRTGISAHLPSIEKMIALGICIRHIQGLRKQRLTKTVIYKMRSEVTSIMHLHGLANICL